MLCERISRIKCCIFVVACHGVFENLIDEIDYRLFASEVTVKVYFFGKGIFPVTLHSFSIGLIFALKNLRLRQPEFIYALLNVTYHEKIVFTSDGIYESFL